ncbi:hypothetical protein ACHQM5_011007 [Ranunculus cassubicifolius]
MASTAWEDDEIELCNNNGFVYKRRKRRRTLEEEAASTVNESSSLDLELQLKKRKKSTLGKIRDRYQKEILHWELLSNTLNALEQTSQHRIQSHEDPVSNESTSQLVQSRFHTNLDELLKQVEAQDAILRDVSMICDMAEAMLNPEEERHKEHFFELPIWETSPRRVFALLCEDDDCSNNADT